jgi:hypothetical protein
MKSNQRGILSARSLFIVVILLVMLVVPLWWLGGKADKRDAQLAKEKAMAGMRGTPTSVITAAPPPATVNNPEAYGMSWGILANDKLPASAVWMSCHGQPRDGISRPHSDSCNPYQGDASCRLALPILCIQKDGSTWEAALGGASGSGSAISPAGVVTDGWAAGQVASSEPVAGFVIGSLAGAHARCEKELGPGWRMAEFHDGAGGQSGWGFVAKRGVRLDTRYRHWVHINNQRGNCWDTGK